MSKASMRMPLLLLLLLPRLLVCREGRARGLIQFVSSATATAHGLDARAVRAASCILVHCINACRHPDDARDPRLSAQALDGYVAAQRTVQPMLRAIEAGGRGRGRGAGAARAEVSGVLGSPDDSQGAEQPAIHHPPSLLPASSLPPQPTALVLEHGAQPPPAAALSPATELDDDAVKTWVSNSGPDKQSVRRPISAASIVVRRRPSTTRPGAVSPEGLAGGLAAGEAGQGVDTLVGPRAGRAAAPIIMSRKRTHMNAGSGRADNCVSAQASRLQAQRSSGLRVGVGADALVSPSMTPTGWEAWTTPTRDLPWPSVNSVHGLPRSILTPPAPDL